MFENPRRGRQARNFTKNVPKILALKSSSEQIFSEDCRWVPLITVKWPVIVMQIMLLLLLTINNATKDQTVHKVYSLMNVVKP